MKKTLALMTAILIALCLTSGCGQTPRQTTGASGAEQITLTITGSREESTAIEAASAAFAKENPNCRVVYEYVQNYFESMKTRLAAADSGVDLFLTTNLQADSDLLAFALELFSQSDKLNLSGTYQGLIDNFTYKDSDRNAAARIYAIPLGAEIRGMYVNQTLLAKVGVAAPQNRTELLAACKEIKAAGYIPLQGNPGTFSQWLMYPYICNMVANAGDYAATYDRISRREPGISELFREPMQFVYDLAAEGYYDYKASEKQYGCFSDSSTDEAARGFLNITGEAGSYTKADDVGFAAFMPGLMSTSNTLAKMKDDYHSGIEYTFILAPTGPDGGYVYMSPADGIAVNKSSPHIDMALAFMNFLFTPENNKRFAEKQNITPNTSDAFEIVKEKFHIPDDRISQLGRVTFDYPFYSIITTSLRNVSKANSPKYMQDNGDGTYTMYSFDEYMARLETDFQQASTAVEK